MERLIDESASSPKRFFQRRNAAQVQRNTTLDDSGCTVYPELDGDGEHVHFEIANIRGESQLWITIRRGTQAELTASSLRKIADLIDRHGLDLRIDAERDEQSNGAPGDDFSGPLSLDFDLDGNLVFPDRRR